LLRKQRKTLGGNFILQHLVCIVVLLWHRRHCQHSSGIWRRTCLPRHTDGAVSAFY